MTVRSLNVDEALYRYILDHSLREHPALKAVRQATSKLPLGYMQTSPEQVQLMTMLIQLMGARRVIEIGVFTGYTTLAFALALPEDGRVLACDINDQYIDIGRLYWHSTGVAEKIDFRLAPAMSTLALIDQGEDSHYDLAYIDADKENYYHYYEKCLNILRPGGIIAIDNVLWGGRVNKPADSPSTAALQLLNSKLHQDSRVDLSMIPIGDGLTLARKR